MQLFKEIYKTMIDFVVDLRSTRVFLIWLSTGLFVFSVLRGVDPISLGIIAGLNTIIYAFYFQSKNSEHKHNDEVK